MFLCSRSTYVYVTYVIFVGLRFAPLPTHKLDMLRLWRQLFPGTCQIFDLCRWRDPAPDSDHLGLSGSVLWRLWEQRPDAIRQVVRDVAAHIALANETELEFGFVCRPRVSNYFFLPFLSLCLRTYVYMDGRTDRRMVWLFMYENIYVRTHARRTVFTLSTYVRTYVLTSASSFFLLSYSLVYLFTQGLAGTVRWRWRRQWRWPSGRRTLRWRLAPVRWSTSALSGGALCRASAKQGAIALRANSAAAPLRTRWTSSRADKY